jgi:hypothetical protein
VLHKLIAWQGYGRVLVTTARFSLALFSIELEFNGGYADVQSKNSGCVNERTKMRLGNIENRKHGQFPSVSTFLSRSFHINKDQYEVIKV